jgi:uncharacterized membrane protein (DUF373 family)
MSFQRFYSYFERAVAGAILLGMAVVILLTLLNFLMSTIAVLEGMPQEVEYRVFQRLFDRVLAALIALEIAHSVRDMVSGRHGQAQLRTVVVIGMLAVIRKLVVIDLETASGGVLAGLAAVVLALAVAFAITVDFGRRDAPEPAPGAGD